MIGAATVLRAALGVPPPRSEGEAQQELIAAAIAAQGRRTVIAAEAAGRSLLPEQAIAEALAWADGAI